MIAFLVVMIYALLVTIGGFAALRLIVRGAGNMPAELWLPISFCLGLGIQAIWYSLMLLLTRSCYAWTLLIPFVALIVASIRWGSGERTGTSFGAFQFVDDLPGPNRLLMTMIGVLIIFCLSLFFCNAFAFPLNSYDGRAIWNLKAKILFHEHTIFGDSFTDPFRVHYHRDYPLMIPFAEFTIHSILNEVQETALRPFFSQVYVFQLLYAYGIQRRLRVPPLVSLLITFFLCSLPMRNDWAERDGGSMNTGNVDIPLALIAMISLTMFLLWWREGRRWQWLLGATFAGLTLLAKKEGMIIVAVVCGANLIQSLVGRHGQPRIKALGISTFAVAAVALAIAIPWFACARSLPNLYDENFAEMIRWDILQHAPERAQVVLLNAGRDLLQLDRWNAFWIFWAAVLLLSLIDRRRRWDFYLDVAIIGWAAAYFFVFLVSPLNLNFHVNTAAARLLNHFLPLALVRIGIFFAPTDEEMGPSKSKEPVPVQTVL